MVFTELPLVVFVGYLPYEVCWVAYFPMKMESYIDDEVKPNMMRCLRYQPNEV